MKVGKIYKRYKVPPRLQDHLLRVTKIALYIGDHWVGPEINLDLIKKSALLHDLGNIVEFDLERYPISKEKDRADFWVKIKKDVTDKYGTNKHQATLKMLEEIGIDPEIAKIIAAKSFPNALKAAKSNNWELKILFYADLRAGPFGILSLEERLDEALPRLEMYRRLNNLNRLVAACYQIEKQMQENLEVDLIGISDKSIESVRVNLLETNI